MNESTVLQLLSSLTPDKLSLLIHNLSQENSINGNSNNNDNPDKDERSINQTIIPSPALEQPPAPIRSYHDQLEDKFIEFNAKLIELKQIYELIGECEYTSIESLDSFGSSLNNHLKASSFNKQELISKFLNSLKSISKLFEIIKQFKDEVNLSNYLSKNSQYLLNSYTIDNDLNLEDYISSNSNTTLTSIMNELESSFIDLQPVFWDKLLDLSKKSTEYHQLYDMLYDESDTENKNYQFKCQLPTLEESSKVTNTPTELKSKKFFSLFLSNLYSSNFKNLSPNLLTTLNFEIANLSNELNNKSVQLKRIFMEINELYEIMGYHDKDATIVAYQNSENVIKSIGLKDSTINKYSAYLETLQAEKLKRQTKLNDYLSELEDYWSILPPMESKSISEFLKINKNLKLESFDNFEKYLKELETLKLQNISKFIQKSRDRIVGYWDILMYDEAERFKFKEFYIDDEYLMSESLLEKHNEEITKLRQKIEDLKPILENISKLNELTQEKNELNISVSNPARLLQRNSFKILRHEEQTREKLNKLIPLTIRNIRQLLNNYQLSNDGHEFKVNGESYLDILNQLEMELMGKSRSTRNSRFQRNNTLLNQKTNNTANSRVANKVVKRNTAIPRVAPYPNHLEPPSSIKRNFSAPSSTLQQFIQDPFHSKNIKPPVSASVVLSTPASRRSSVSSSASRNSSRYENTRTPSVLQFESSRIENYTRNPDIFERLSPIKPSSLNKRSQSLTMLKTPLGSKGKSNTLGFNEGLSPVRYSSLAYHNQPPAKVPELLSDSEISMTEDNHSDENKENSSGAGVNYATNTFTEGKCNKDNDFGVRLGSGMQDISLNWDTETF